MRNHKSHAHVVKQTFPTVLQIISPDMHRGGLEMAITYAHLYCGIAAHIERGVQCCGKIMPSRRFQTNMSVSLRGSSAVGILALWRHGCSRRTKTLHCRSIRCPWRGSKNGPKRSANSCSSCPPGDGDLAFPPFAKAAGAVAVDTHKDKEFFPLVL